MNRAVSLDSVKKPSTIQKSQIKNSESSFEISQRDISCSKLNIPFKFHPPPAAPFPSLPQAKEIKIYIRRIDADIAREKVKLELMEREISKKTLIIPSSNEIPPQFQIQNFHDFFIPQKLVEELRCQNQKKAQTSHQKHTLKSHSIKQKVTHICNLPYFLKTLYSIDDFVDDMFRSISEIHQARIAKERLLCSDYMNYKELQHKYYSALESWQREDRRSLDSWPVEVKKQPPKTTDVAILSKYTSRDQPMILSDIERESTAFYSENGYVQDPLAEHNQYRNRLVWTQEETQIFLERYLLHPREFKKIASYLPSKSIKEVIEFYYLHRIDMHLKDLENRQKKRGRKKVITEGVVKK